MKFKSEFHTSWYKFLRGKWDVISLVEFWIELEHLYKQITIRFGLMGFVLTIYIYEPLTDEELNKLLGNVKS